MWRKKCGIKGEQRLPVLIDEPFQTLHPEGKKDFLIDVHEREHIAGHGVASLVQKAAVHVIGFPGAGVIEGIAEVKRVILPISCHVIHGEPLVLAGIKPAERVPFGIHKLLRIDDGEVIKCDFLLFKSKNTALQGIRPLILGAVAVEILECPVRTQIIIILIFVVLPIAGDVFKGILLCGSRRSCAILSAGGKQQKQQQPCDEKK